MTEQEKDADEIDETGPIIDIPEDSVIEETVESQQEQPEAHRFSKFAEKTAQKARSIKIDPVITITWLEKFLDFARSKYSPERFEGVADWSIKYGHYGLLAAELLCLLYGVVAAIKFRDASALLTGVGYALLIVILQYTASKFLSAGARLLKSSPSRIGSAAFLDCFALLTEIAGLLIFLSMLSEKNIGSIFVGLGIWALCDAIAYIALNPEMANVEISGDVRAGEEGIGIMSFIPKAIIRITPIAFGIGTILGSIGLLCSLFSIIKSANMAPAQDAIELIILCACLPFACYIFFAIYHLVIDLIRAILVIPGKIDSLKSSE